MFPAHDKGNGNQFQIQTKIKAKRKLNDKQMIENKVRWLSLNWHNPRYLSLSVKCFGTFAAWVNKFQEVNDLAEDKFIERDAKSNLLLINFI